MKRCSITLILLFTAIVLFVSTTIELKSQHQAVSAQKQTFDDNEIPLTDFTAPEEVDGNKRAKRQAKSKKYDKSQVIDPTETISDVAVRSGAVDTNLPAFPVAHSSAVIIGEITDAQAHLSNDKTGIYSEFNIRVEKVLKNYQSEPISSGSTVDAEREGGRVRLQSGHIFRYIIEKQRMPRARRRYLLFLTRKNQEEGFHILTGYELRGGKVFSLDNISQPKAYDGTNESTFLEELQTILSSPTL